MSAILLMIGIISIWFSLLVTLVILFGAVYFLLKNIRPPKNRLEPLSSYPLITIVVPAHNEEIVIQDTVKAILSMNYPREKMEILVFAEIMTTIPMNAFTRSSNKLKMKATI